MKMMRKQFTLSLLCGWVIAAFCLVCTPTLAHAAAYNIIDLGKKVETFGEEVASAYGINNASQVQVVGDSSASAGNSAFIWSDQNSNGVSDFGEMKDLGVLGFGSNAYAVNDSGTPVGVSPLGCCDPRAVYYNTSTWSPIQLDTVINPTVDATTSWTKLTEARDVNNSGKIVGWGTLDVGGSPQTQGFLLNGVTGSPTPTSLGLLGGGKTTLAQAINESDQIAGEGGVLGRAWVSDSGTLYDLGFNIGLFPWSGALDINESSQVVGWIKTVVSQQRAFALTPDFTDSDGDGNPWFSQASGKPAGQNALFQNLGTLNITAGGSSVSFAINDLGLVVGQSTYELPGGGISSLVDQHAFLWAGSGPIVDLNTLISDPSWVVLQRASDINNAGYITGWGVRTVNGQNVRRAFLLIPNPAVPEPATLLLLGTGLAGLGLFRRRTALKK